VVVLIEGVVKLPPVPNELPPVRLLNQFMVSPPTSVALKVTVPGPQREPFVPIGAAGIGFIVAVTGVLGLSHPAAEVLDT
jgi:hypothetical protein